MVASGLPKRNGDQHVQEIARLSLDLLNTLKHIHIEHLREIHLQLRIGFHTGKLNHNLLNFLNGIILLQFLELSIIIFRDIKMRT